jgi:hypothetical protein
MPFDWDLFVSHNRVNKPWVRPFVHQWREFGLRVFFDEESIEPGEELVAGIERGLNGSRHVVLFLSPASLASRWVALETSISLHTDPNAAERKLIPVVLEPIDTNALRPTLARLTRIDLTDPLSRLEQYRHLLRFLNLDPALSLPANPREIYISVNSLVRLAPPAMKTAMSTITALADIGPALKPFGTYQGADPKACLEHMQAASAQIVVFPQQDSADVYPATALAVLEYRRARQHNVQVLAYAPEDLRGISASPLRAFFDEVKDHVATFNGHEDFEHQIARDLDRVAQANLSADLENYGQLYIRHERVVEKLYAGDLASADTLNQSILTATDSKSPRANYNQACIESWHAETDGTSCKDLLFKARRYFEKSVELGIVCLIALRSDPPASARAIIGQNPAFELLLRHYPELITIVDDNLYFGRKWKSLGGGCIEAGVPIALADGRTEPASCVKVRDRVVTWNAAVGEPSEGIVRERKSHVVSEILVINGHLRLTAVHPVLVRGEWVRAGDIQLGDLAQLASGQLQSVTSIERRTGRFTVLDFSVDPLPTFVASGVVVHNK